MRGWVLVVVAAGVAASVAHADMSVPTTRTEPKWVTQCSARLEQARAAAAVEVPAFAAAHVVGADVYVDESTFSLGTPVLFEAYVVPRRTQWSDPDVTVRRWTAVGAEPLSIYRQSRELEGAIVAYHMSRLVTRAQLDHLVDGIFKPAVDDCLRLSAAE
jgi:hypothetical protein